MENPKGYPNGQTNWVSQEKEYTIDYLDTNGVSNEPFQPINYAPIDVYLFIEDHDNAELSHEDWLEQMEDAVVTYNEQYGTSFNPKHTVYNYINRVIKPD